MRLVEQLRVLGVRRGGVVLVHTSFRAVGPLEGGPLALIEALRAAIGPEGTLVMPTMTDGESVFDPRTTPAAGMGMTAELSGVSRASCAARIRAPRLPRRVRSPNGSAVPSRCRHLMDPTAPWGASTIETARCSCSE